MSGAREYLYESLLNEDSLKMLSAKSDPARKARATTRKGAIWQVKRTQDNKLWISIRTRADGKIYTEFITVDHPTFDFFAIKDVIKDFNKFKKALLEAKASVYCSCDDFFLGGAKFNLGPYGNLPGHTMPISYGAKAYSEPTVVNIQPNVRDPKREHVLCKHLIAAVNSLGTDRAFIATIMNTIIQRQL